MKKKLVGILLTLALVGTLCGCSVGKEIEIDATQESEVSTEGIEEEFVISEMLEMENVKYPLFEGWTLFKDVNGTLCYINADNNQTISLFVQRETAHTPEEMYEVYEKTINTTFELQGEPSTAMFGLRNWRQYFSTQETVNGTVSTNCYLFSTGDTTVYVEISSKDDASYVDEEFLSALDIDTSNDKDWKSVSNNDVELEKFTLGSYEFSKPANWVLDSEGDNRISYISETGYEIYAFQFQSGLGGSDLDTIMEAMKTSCEENIGQVAEEYTWDADTCSWVVYKYETISEGYDVYTYMYTDGTDMALICATVPEGSEVTDFENCLNSMRVIK